MDIKQGEEKTEFVKEENEIKEEYIFQKNSKTKFGAKLIIAVLIIITGAILTSLYFFKTPA